MAFMITGSGKRISEGIAFGKLIWYQSEKTAIDPENSPKTVGSAEEEIKRYQSARKKLEEQLRELHEKALESAGEKSAEIFNAYAFVLKDESLNQSITNTILEQHCSAEYAVKAVSDAQARRISEIRDSFFQERGEEIRGLAQELLNILMDARTQADSKAETGNASFILLARNLFPAELVRLCKTGLRGIVLREGSAQSHTVILARAMQIPVLIQCKEIEAGWNGKQGILDGYSGTIYADPTQEQRNLLVRKRTEEEKKREQQTESLQELIKKKENRTTGEASIRILAAISGLTDPEDIFLTEADGIGLFRSEFLYLNREGCPSEEEQFEVYRQVLKAFAPKPVTIRTADLGADKTAAYLHLEPEEDPALGLRGIRFSLRETEIFKTQLRALLHASAYGNLRILFPMITSVEEIRDCKKLLEECRRELMEKGIYTGQVPVGTMIETPAAVFCAQELACEVDFFSIGTNDLTQYICVIDRMNPRMEAFFDPHHPAVLRAVSMTAKAAHRQGIPVGICGELAADASMAETFLQMGIGELSVIPNRIRELKRTYLTVAFPD